MNISRKILLAGAVAAASLAIGTAAAAQATATASTSAAVTVITPISATVTGTLNFGRVVLNDNSTDGTITLSNGSNTLGVTNATAVAGGTISQPVFTVKGESGQLYNMVVTPTLSIGGQNRLTATGGFGTGASNLTPGGVVVPLNYSLLIPAGTASNTYNGTIAVQVTYQ